MKTAVHYLVRLGGLRLWLLLCAAALPGLTWRASAAAAAGKAEVFKLREVSVFDHNEHSFLVGQRSSPDDKASAEVKHYPALASTKPIYGSVRFGADYGETNSGMLFYFVMDESRGTGKGYDRLYFDLNRDLDLRDDPVLKPQASPPDKAKLTYSSIKQQVIFDFVNIDFDFGPAGMRPVQIMPRLTVQVYDKEEYKQVSFVRTRLYEGQIQAGGQLYKAQLGNNYWIRGRLDVPSTALFLSGSDRNRRITWWGGDRLSAAHKVGGRFFTFSATPTGDELTVVPYAGDLGLFEIGSGGRAVTNLSVRGSLDAKDRAVAVGGELADYGAPQPAQRCELPVGDYRPNYITVTLGRLSLNISHNYHADGKPRGGIERPPVYGMTVRKDKPYVLDFSDKPEVMFASPARDQKVKRGDTIEVKAVLVDPKLDFMIRGLDDTSRKATEGENQGRNVSLDPKVVITRADGKQVAEGVMPFG